MGIKILVVDDEPQIRKFLKVSLRVGGYDTDEVTNGQEAIQRAVICKPDIILLDLGLPDMDGKKVINQIREWSQVPIIVLTARDQEKEKVEALDAGADDYVTKPFGVEELMARIRVFIRRTTRVDDKPVVVCGELTVDLAQRHIFVSGKEVKLTPTEYEIIKVLAQNVGKVITHRQLFTAVWGNNYYDDNHYIRVYINQLRRKIEDNPIRPKYIVTESGVGYRLMDH
ncbi:response regulator [Sporomusa acidovorans]|uniref:Transcriptional regulatory protein KdpE n=1 Tax=Sporomusa acidovorans (strain ATCC 49682 / DSM 3132 / Mol) TaxID=1123286 RepID=A0ABZ3IWS1_SPOA4|nr:response regulator transcription factor [Sporomusa acidovorans]OZC23392.1 KDP operon transcriptional regulatory protein KdpE [Sporomusa acidovorans DSM 3132]SDE44048.1 two-component system, OmpR family, KDP operon response regulator KdpE [Sporomusa acidovorans]